MTQNCEAVVVRELFVPPYAERKVTSPRLVKDAVVGFMETTALNGDFYAPRARDFVPADTTGRDKVPERFNESSQNDAASRLLLRCTGRSEERTRINNFGLVALCDC